MKLTITQETAIKCAFVDLCASYRAWRDMDVYSHDWVAHSQSIDELMEAFPFLMETKKELNINLEDEEEEISNENPFKLVNIRAGSHRQGQITTTYQALVDCFGEPNHEGDGGYKVSFEWAIEFADGTFATIYDWKWSEEERVRAKTGGEFTFNIGGFNRDATHKVHEAMGLVSTV